MMYLNGSHLQKHYATEVKGVESEKAKAQKQSDMNAMKAYLDKKRQSRLARMEERDANHVNPYQELENLEKDPTKDIDVKRIVDEAKSKTNVIARQYGLPEPNNPEALIHDRFHCITCDRKLHNPNAHKQAGLDIFDDSEVRIMCCWCFGRFGDEQIQVAMEKKGEADKRVRLAVYDPVEFCKEEIEYLTDMKRIQIKSKYIFE